MTTKISSFHKIAATAALYWSFAALGVLIASLGAAFLALGRLTMASPALLSLAFSARSIGYLIGSALGGVLLDARPRQGHAIVAASLLLAAVATAAIPYSGVNHHSSSGNSSGSSSGSGSIWLLSVLVSTQGLSMGALDTIGNILIIALHGGGGGGGDGGGGGGAGGVLTKRCNKCDSADPFMQALHCFFALGGLLAPLVVRYSMDRADGDISGAFLLFAAITAAGGVAFVLLPTPPSGSAAGSQEPAFEGGVEGERASQEYGQVQLSCDGYAGDGGVERGKYVDDDDDDDDEKEEEEGEDGDDDDDDDDKDGSKQLIAGGAPPRTDGRRVVLLTALLLGLCVGAEVSCGGLVTLYATTGECRLTEAEGQGLAALFWGSLTLGRALAVPLSFAMSAAALLAADVAVCGVALALFLAHTAAAAAAASSSSIDSSVDPSSRLQPAHEEGGLPDSRPAAVSCALLYAATAALGLGLSSMFPTALMQAEALLSQRSAGGGEGGGSGLSGRAASVIMVGSASGEMLVPVVIGIWTALAPVGFVYGLAIAIVLFSATALQLVLREGRLAFKLPYR